MQTPSHALNPKSWNAYDINIGRCHNVMKQMVLNGEGLKGQYKKSDGMSNLESHLLSFLKDYCRINEIPMNFENINKNNLIIYPSLDNTYIYFCALGILSMDYAKIHSYLDFQLNLYPGNQEDFLNLQEHVIYYSVGSLSPILNESLRQRYIMTWVNFMRNPERGLHTPSHGLNDHNEHSEIDTATTQMLSINFVNIDIDNLFECLKKYFDENHFEDLENILKNNPNKEKPIFKSNGNTFAFVFYQLKEANRIIESKQHICKWIKQKFKYSKENGPAKSFDEEYVRKVISGQKNTNQVVSLDKIITPN